MSDSVVVLAWVSDVDLANVTEIRTGVDAAMRTPGIQQLVIDLAELTFIDSLGLGALVYAMNECRKINVSFSLRHVPEATMRLFRLAHLDMVFTIET